MIKIYDNLIDYKEILSREISAYPQFEESVKEIVANVVKNGDRALYEYSEKFDKVTLQNLVVTKEEINQAYEKVDASFVEILKKAKANIEEYHQMQKRQGFEIKKEVGIVLGQKITPVEKAGIYVPGGTASYPSTVLMNAVPAKIAGVSQIVMTTPPGKDGSVKAEILVAADLCKVDKIIKCGGAQAIAALAYGSESVPKVDKIVGPGNIFVALAKRQVFGTVSIDMIAGPSEILIVADSSADARQLAADLLSQAEHDRLASAVLVTNSMKIAESVSACLEEQIPKLERADIARESIDKNGKIIVTSDLEKAIEVSNLIAPEHLEICTENPFECLDKVKNAGSVFLGRYSPEPLGDYFAGPNHTLPTGGSARFSSALSVDDFIKKTQYIYYTKDCLKEVYEDIATFARAEGLTAHARAVEVRFEETKEE